MIVLIGRLTAAASPSGISGDAAGFRTSASALPWGIIR